MSIDPAKACAEKEGDVRVMTRRRSSAQRGVFRSSWAVRWHQAMIAGVVAVCCVLMAGCGSGHGSSGATIVVNSAADPTSPAAGEVTLRSAIERAMPGDRIVFDRALDGGTIVLTQVGEEHSLLKGETYSGMTFAGYRERDYGRSALYARKNLTIDASGLGSGITIKWGGDSTQPARVLAVYGDLTMKNVTIAGGCAAAAALAGDQPFTLARGGGLAVWGTATLRRCTIAGNRCIGDTRATRDRGAFGGGIYCNGLSLTDCVVSGNSAVGYGAAGGGIYSVGGGDNANGRGNDTRLVGCTVSGNRVTAQHAYGGGIFTLSGGPENTATMSLSNCTVARNLVEDNPDLPQVVQYYYRGGGVYLGGGSLGVMNCTIAENEVNGQFAMIGGKPNMGGGGVAATIGNAHVVEDASVGQSIVAGNKLNGTPSDWFAGSLIDFHSYGYNLIGAIDFSQILVPVPDWMNLSRKHYPKAGDRDGVALSQAIDPAGARLSGSVVSVGVDAGRPTVLWYRPVGLASRKIPASGYGVTFVTAGYSGFGQPTDDFLNQVVLKVRTVYGSVLGSDFGASMGDRTGVTWFGPRVTWPSDPANAAWIAAWHDLDAAIGGRLGPAGLDDDFWSAFSSGPIGKANVMTVKPVPVMVRLAALDQVGAPRGRSGLGDIGAIEE